MSFEQIFSKKPAETEGGAGAEEGEIDLTRELNQAVAGHKPLTEAQRVQIEAAKRRKAAGRPGFMSEDTSEPKGPQTDHGIGEDSLEEEK